MNCLQVDSDDKYFYGGTTSGDILVINMTTRKFRGIQPTEKRRYACGVSAIGHINSGFYIVGTGDGLVSACDPLFYRTKSGSPVLITPRPI